MYHGIGGILVCESSVYLLNGSEKTIVMSDVSRIIVSGDGVTCIGTLGERRDVPGVRISDAMLSKHEVLLKPRSG